MIKKEELPRWNLKEIYNNIYDEEIKKDIELLTQKAKDFAQNYQGQLHELSAEAFFCSIKDYENLSDKMGYISSYGSLIHAQKQDDEDVSRFYQNLRENITQVATHILFYTLEINKQDDEKIAHWLRDEKIVHYSSWIEHIRKQKPHQLSDDVEQILLEKNNTGRAAWVRLYDETFAAYKFNMQGKDVSITAVLNALSAADEKERKEAARALSVGLKENENLAARIYNVIMADKSLEDNWRGFKQPVSVMNLENDVEDEVIEALSCAVKENYKHLAHRYYAYKAKKFGVKKLKYWDRNAPYPQNKEKEWGFDEAKDFILKAYKGFSPQLSELAQQFFDKGWIDAPAVAGKYSGAFAHPSVPSHHPYILVNWFGKKRDVMTLAHELGHGVHQLLAAEQGALMADTPLTLAETASVFGEMLTFRQLLSETSNKEEKELLLASKIEDMLNTVVRQIAFHHFETKAHNLRKEGELSAEKLREIWMEVQKESLGEAIELDESYETWWIYVSHFFHVPFYVYAYAFGDCLVNSLYQVYMENPQNFENQYIDMLKAGGTKNHKELLAPFGLDATKADFWKKGLDMIAGFIDELEELS